MQSGVIHLKSGLRSGEALVDGARACLPEDLRSQAPAPDLVCGFVPPGETLQPLLDELDEAWPDCLRVGCEAVTQFADGEMASGGTLQLFWFEHPESRPEVIVLHGTHEDPPPDDELEGLATLVVDEEPMLVLADGLRFPAEELVDRLRERLRAERGGQRPRGSGIFGGLASQAEPIASAGARVFLGREIHESACLVVMLRGVEMVIEIVRGWDPASPCYTVTAAEKNVLHAIDGESATEWFRRFFTIEGGMAPLPESAYRFPLIIDGPKPERRNLYRSMKSFDDPPGAVTFWGKLEVGDRIRLGMGNDASLLRTAASLPGGPRPEAAMLYSCVGRQAVLGSLAAREVATIHEALGGASLAGFFTFGEIGPTAAGGPAFYNHTAVLALLRERRP